MCRAKSIVAMLVTVLAAPCGLSHVALAQVPAPGLAPGQNQQSNQNAYVAVVTSDDVYVRAGAGSSYYPFGKLNSGDFVQVVGEKFGWARVRTVGPAFRSFFGYVKYPRNETGRFRLEASGESGTTEGVALGVTEILAPNLNTKNDPRDSWKWLVKLGADDRVTVIETFETEQETVHKIVLPADAEGWVSAAYLRPASPQESETFRLAVENPRLLAEAPVAPPVDQGRRQGRSNRGAAPSTSGDVQPISNVDAPQRQANHQPRIEPPASDIPGAQPDAQPNHAPPRPAPQPQPSSPNPNDDREFADPIAEPIDENTNEIGEGNDPDAINQQPLSTDVSFYHNEDGEQPAATSVDQPSREPTLDDLELALERLTKQPLETTEVAPLRKMYLDLAQRADRESVQRYAQTRADQLNLWMEAQLRKQELTRLRERASSVLSETDEARRAMDLRSEYVAVGKLETSTIFDGSRLPRLLRLQESSTGRTIAYLQPNNDIDLVAMVGQLIGIVGEKNFDPGLRLNIIQPRRIDLLTPQGGKTEAVLTPQSDANESQTSDATQE